LDVRAHHFGGFVRARLKIQQHLRARFRNSAGRQNGLASGARANELGISVNEQVGDVILRESGAGELLIIWPQLLVAF